MGSEIWDLKQSRAPLSVSVSSLIAIGREHEKTKTAKSGMSFGKEANKRIIFAVGAEACFCLWQLKYRHARTCLILVSSNELGVLLLSPMQNWVQTIGKKVWFCCSIVSYVSTFELTSFSHIDHKLCVWLLLAIQCSIIGGNIWCNAIHATWTEGLHYTPT